MRGRTGTLTIAAKLRFVLAAAATALAALVWQSVRVLDHRMLEEREAKVRAAVETMHALVGEYERLASDGRMARDAAQRAAIEAIRAARYEGREYFWVNDLQPRMIVHPARPERVRGDDRGRVQQAEDREPERRPSPRVRHAVVLLAEPSV